MTLTNDQNDRLQNAVERFTDEELAEQMRSLYEIHLCEMFSKCLLVDVITQYMEIVTVECVERFIDMARAEASVAETAEPGQQ